MTKPHKYTKVDIINSLVKARGWKSYLEICTGSTGRCYDGIDKTQLKICKRLVYNCPSSYDDGMEIDYYSESFDITTCLKQIKKSKLKYDIILVDPWHEYETSYRDLEVAFNLLKRGGEIIVHDCNPTDEKIVSPRFCDGPWCGVTYKAYVDFLLNHSLDISYYTVNTDYGCGVIQKLAAGTALLNRIAKYTQYFLPQSHGSKSHSDKTPHSVIDQWKSIGDDYNKIFNFFRGHSDDLLRLKTYGEFLNGISSSISN